MLLTSFYGVGLGYRSSRRSVSFIAFLEFVFIAQCLFRLLRLSGSLDKNDLRFHCKLFYHKPAILRRRWEYEMFGVI